MADRWREEWGKKAYAIAKGYQLTDGTLRATDVLVGFSTASLNCSCALSDIAAAPQDGDTDRIALRLAGLYVWHASCVREHNRWPTYVEFTAACGKQALTNATGGWTLHDTLCHSAHRKNGASLRVMATCLTAGVR